MALATPLRDLEPAARPLVVCLEGWIDAGIGASAAMASLRATCETELLVTFDGDELIDHRARRPIMHIEQGVLGELAWPEPEIYVARDRSGAEALLLVGPEPDMRWHAFCEEVAALAAGWGCTRMVGFGAFPAPVPHTRPTRLAITASNAELARAIGFVGGTIDVPCGVQAPLEQACAAKGMDACTLWARVPHYIANVPWPSASVALLDGLHNLTGLAVETTSLTQAAMATRGRIDGLITNSDDHGSLLAQLEAQYDAEFGTIEQGPQLPGADELPSGDELAIELERFLRGQDGQ